MKDIINSPHCDLIYLYTVIEPFKRTGVFIRINIIHSLSPDMASVIFAIWFQYYFYSKFFLWFPNKSWSTYKTAWWPHGFCDRCLYKTGIIYVMCGGILYMLDISRLIIIITCFTRTVSCDHITIINFTICCTPWFLAYLYMCMKCTFLFQ